MKETIDAKQVRGDVKLSFRQRVDYGVYEFGYYLTYNWITLFMSLYYTEVIGVPLTSVAALTLLVRIFDAVNDPIIGSIADRTKSRWGRYKPWTLVGGLCLAVLVALMFSASPDWGMSLKVVYMYVLYILVTLASTACYMPYSALNGVLSANAAERVTLSNFRVVFQNIGGQMTGMIAVPMVLYFAGTKTGPEAAPGYSKAVIICAAVFIPIAIYTSARVKEVVLQPPKQDKIPLKTQLACLVKNPCALIAVLGLFMHGTAQYGRAGMLSYYFQYVVGDLGLVGVYSTISLVACFIGPPAASLLHKALKHKGKAMTIAFLGVVVTTAPIYFIREIGIAFWLLLFVGQICVSAVGGISYGLVGDVTDYGEYKFGVRVDGFLASFVSLSLKVGGAVGPAALMLVIDQLGFVPNAATQNIAVVNALAASISLVISACSLIAAIAFLFYKLSDTEQSRIWAELEKRRAQDIS